MSARVEGYSLHLDPSRITTQGKEPSMALVAAKYAGRHWLEDGSSVRVTPGQVREDKDPIVKLNPAGWVPFEDVHPVERATARPGEKRSTKRASKGD